MTITSPSSGAVIPFPEPRPSPEPYLKIRHSFFRSPAWQSLPAVARALYFEIADRHNGRNNGQIPYAKRDAVDALHISDATACRMMSLLEKQSLAIRTRRGAFDLKTKEAKSSEWFLPELNTTSQFPEEKRTTKISPEHPVGFTRAPNEHVTRTPLRRRSKRINKEEDDGTSKIQESPGENCPPLLPSETIPPGAKKNGSAVAFDGQTVRPTAAQMERWWRDYPHIDLVATLRHCDDHLTENPSADGKWLGRTSSWLRRENAAYQKSTDDEDSF